MNSFFLVLELIFIYAFAIYLMVNKRELSIIYIPVLFFVSRIIDSSIPAVFYYIMVSSMVLMYIFSNRSFYRNNIYAFILVIYLFILLPRSSNLELIRPFVFSVTWLFLLIPLISAVYLKYSREQIFKELTNSAFLILTLFIANVVVSTLHKFSPHEMYGITSGIMYGNLWAASLNILSIALFVILIRILIQKKLVYVVVYVIAFCFVMLTLRRSVMGLTLFGVLIGALTLLTQKNAKTLLLVGGLAFVIGYTIYSSTDIASQFNERVELRDLEDRELGEEKRFIEYTLLYEDMFIYEEYSPWYGYELFNSGGNYGRGFLLDRSLHGDLTNIVHSSGFIGLFLYLLMVKTSFVRAFRSAKQHLDKLIILFCAVTFMAYTITGRYTEVGATMFLFLVLMLPLAKNDVQEIPATSLG